MRRAICDYSLKNYDGWSVAEVLAQFISVFCRTSCRITCWSIAYWRLGGWGAVPSFV